MSLTAAQLQERIARVEEDIKQLRQSGADEKKLTTLAEYKDYLKDELQQKQGQ